MKLTTTLNRIREHSPCTDGWKKLNKYLGSEYGEGTPINLLTILDSNGVQDMLWCLRATVEDSNPVSSQLAIAFAEEVLPIFESRYPADSRPRMAIQAAKDYAEGKISIEEVRAAANAAANAAFDAANATANVAKAAFDAAYAAYAANAAYAAFDAAYAAAYAAAAAARGKARQRQADIIRGILQ